MANIYREHRIFKHKAGTAIIYVCFENLKTGKFAVQQLEFFQKNESMARANEVAFNTLDLFSEDDPSVRCSWFDDIFQAIESHDQLFENDV